MGDALGANGRKLPNALRDWDDRVGAWCDAYRSNVSDAEIVKIDLQIAVYLFDQTRERVILAYGLSSTQMERRDTTRMRGFPDVNASIGAELGERAFLADRGHFLGHASGGSLDINLFPHRRELNRGWSEQGRRFREMERYAAEHIGTFMFHRALYDDTSWIPCQLEYGLLVRSRQWWVDRFQNK